jgi:uncharacterized membrane protein
MLLLALLVRLGASRALIGALGCVLVFGHNLLDYARIPEGGALGVLSTLFLTGRGAIIPLSSGRIIVLLYSALPWAGMLLIGYFLGALYAPDYDAARRKRILLNAGCSVIALFVLLRWLNGYGDPAPWSAQRNAAHTLLSFLNATKQPPSLLYVSMTVGPVLVLLSLVEKVQNGVTAFFTVYGNVPYFYFIMHLLLLRAMNILLIITAGLEFKSDGNPLVWQAQGFGYPLWMIYLYWLFVVGALYFPCRWYGKYKRTHRQWWLSYL